MTRTWGGMTLRTRVGFKFHAVVSNHEQVSSGYCYSFSLKCINEYLATDSGGYLFTDNPRALIVTSLNTYQRSGMVLE